MEFAFAQHSGPTGLATIIDAYEMALRPLRPPVCATAIFYAAKALYATKLKPLEVALIVGALRQSLDAPVAIAEPLSDDEFSDIENRLRQVSAVLPAMVP